ncbi:MAG: 50S ribosomal protein L24 [Gammaproteobacteria bacterium]|jgi:large subunit ribosomal protein L24|nr:50S ribosomal protein L24 [Gammaproteobacteria bacterium]MDP6616706.1 50S ribosomal protein L24 [Gammaproteobacteria bacterium]MDP6695975.1 50S ribosomal protein L24 [Gammaproteobacteria bacterium]
MERIKKGDDVIVVAGKDKGRRGTVLNVIDIDGQVLVEGINVVKKHTKPNPNAGVQGGIVDMERPIHVSNVMLFNPVTGKGDRIGIKMLEDGRKVRYFKSNNEVVDV